MRYDTAVSEILGAVFLIGLVVIAFSVIGVIFLSNTPSTISSNPVATTGSHCVKCADNWYELYVTHDGGEPYSQKSLEFKVFNASGPIVPDPTPVAVYQGQPAECVGSSSLDTYVWTGSEQFVSGDVAQFTLETLPTKLIITDLNNNPIDTFDYQSDGEAVYKDLTNISYDPSLSNPALFDPTEQIGWDKVNNTPTGKLSPMVDEDSVKKVGTDYCTAIFYYDNTLGVRVEAPVCDAEKMIVDAQNNYLMGSNNCSKPWNEFVGVGATNVNWTLLQKNMGQTTVFEPNEAPGNSKVSRSREVKFLNGIQWRLGNSVSNTVYCPIPPPTPTPTVTATPTMVPTATATVVIPVDAGGVGAQVYAGDSTSDVIVDFAYSDAGYKNEFKLSSPRSVSLGWSQGTPPSRVSGSTPFGTVWNLGKFTAGQELIFTDTANGQTYQTGPASRNPDNFIHGAVSLKNTTGTYHKYLVSYEDFWQGGDKDYNDVEFYVSGNVYVQSAPTPAPTPTPLPDTIAPAVSISSPAAGVNWKRQTKHDIKWSATDAKGVTHVEIKLSMDNGVTYPTVLLDTSTNTGKYSWTIPKINGNQAKIKVIAYDAAENPGSKESGTFIISI